MLIKHEGVSPTVDPSAWVAPNAVVCGDVRIGPGCRVMFGAQIVAEGGSIVIGRECIIMENAVLRSDEEMLLPALDTELQAGDRILFAGRHGVKSLQDRFYLDPSPLDYIRSGVEPPRSWLFRKLRARQGRAQSQQAQAKTA